MSESKHKYKLDWSEEDQQYVGLHTSQPYLSWLDECPIKAIEGIVKLLEDEGDEEEDKCQNG